jgi:hypothetical protein
MCVCGGGELDLGCEMACCKTLIVRLLSVCVLDTGSVWLYSGMLMLEVLRDATAGGW